MAEVARKSRRQWEAFVALNVGKIPADELRRRMLADGYSEQDASQLIGREAQSDTKRNLGIMAAGVGFFLLGAMLSAGSRSGASAGGSYYVFIGALTVGPIAFVYGLVRLFSSRR